jgi:2,5-diamino-6-(ribosylamino)-4(3H)-pyrimidinone 5'-phosphate reductase
MKKNAISLEYMLPYVIVHNAISVDGRLDLIQPDLGLYYKIAANFNEDATLVGSGTMLSASDDEGKEDERVYEKPRIDAKDTRPILFIVDSKGLVRNWHVMKTAGYWKNFVALCSERTPKDYFTYLSERHIEWIMTGTEKVDLPKALEKIYLTYGVRRIRVDSGGILNGVLLRHHLVDEISILIHPQVVGGDTPKSLFVDSNPWSEKDTSEMILKNVERFDNNILWLCYQVLKKKKEGESPSLS